MKKENLSATDRYEWKPSNFLFREYEYHSDVWISVNRKIPLWMGRERMAFGFKFQMGILESILAVGHIDISICCGPVDKYYQSLKTIMKVIVNSNPENDPLLGIPRHSIVKPYYEDTDFEDVILTLMEKAVPEKK